MKWRVTWPVAASVARSIETAACSCNSGGCDTSNCSDSGGAGSGPPDSCNFGESYAGTIEVRLVR